jgi:glycosyltransferase involved in cell wall biosynthesis
LLGCIARKGAKGAKLRRELKNILYLCEGSGFAGAETYAYNLITYISANQGAQVSFGTFYQGLLREKLLKHNIGILDLYGRHNLKSVRRIIQYVKRNRVDIIHFVDLKSTVVGGFAGLFLRKVKTVSTIHGLPERDYIFLKNVKYVVSLLIYFVFLRFLVDRVICVSEDLRARMVRIIGSEKTHVVHNGIPLQTDSKGFKAGSEKRNYLVGSAGRLNSIKGYIFLVQCAKQILEKRTDVEFCVIGTGPLEMELKKAVRSFGLDGRFSFPGFREDAALLISRMDIFVLPSLHEGIPYALLEAMSCSKPVVCTSVGGVKEVVQHEVDGLLVSPRDPNALSEAIAYLLDNPDYAVAIGRNARKKIEGRFSADWMATKTCDLYFSMIAGHP